MKIITHVQALEQAIMYARHAHDDQETIDAVMAELKDRLSDARLEETKNKT